MWHHLTSTVVLRGRHGTYGTGWRAWTWLGARDAAAFCVAGVAQTHIYRHFTWQAWHHLTSTVVLRGRRGTYGTGWRAWTWLGARDAAAFCVAGVAQTRIYRHFTWPAWHHLTSTIVLRGRRGTYGTGWRVWTWLGARDAAAFCVAGVAQTHIYRHFTWQAWHNLTSTDVLRGRRGTDSHLPSCCVAGVAQSHIYQKKAEQLTHKQPTHRQLTLHTYIHDIHTYLPTYIHTYIPTILPSRSFTTSFVFPSFPVPAKTIEAHFRKKLT